MYTINSILINGSNKPEIAITLITPLGQAITTDNISLKRLVTDSFTTVPVGEITLQGATASTVTIEINEADLNTAKEALYMLQIINDASTTSSPKFIDIAAALTSASPALSGKFSASEAAIYTFDNVTTDGTSLTPTGDTAVVFNAAPTTAIISVEKNYLVKFVDKTYDVNIELNNVTNDGSYEIVYSISK